MDSHPCTRDVFENAFVRGGFASFVMFRLKSIDRHHDIKFLELFPGGRDDPKGARNEPSSVLDRRRGIRLEWAGYIGIVRYWRGVRRRNARSNCMRSPLAVDLRLQRQAIAISEQ